MNDLEFISSLDSTPKWIISNDDNKLNKLNNNNSTFIISMEQLMQNTFKNYPGALMYYKNGKIFTLTQLLFVMCNVRWFWTNMNKQYFYETIFLPNLYIFNDDTFSNLKLKFDLKNVFNLNKLDISKEELFMQLITKEYTY